MLFDLGDGIPHGIDSLVSINKPTHAERHDPGVTLGHEFPRRAVDRMIWLDTPRLIERPEHDGIPYQLVDLIRNGRFGISAQILKALPPKCPVVTQGTSANIRNVAVIDLVFSDCHVCTIGQDPHDRPKDVLPASHSTLGHIRPS